MYLPELRLADCLYDYNKSRTFRGCPGSFCECAAHWLIGIDCLDVELIVKHSIVQYSLIDHAISFNNCSTEREVLRTNRDLAEISKVPVRASQEARIVSPRLVLRVESDHATPFLS